MGNNYLGDYAYIVSVGREQGAVKAVKESEDIRVRPKGPKTQRDEEEKKKNESLCQTRTRAQLKTVDQTRPRSRC
jgi:hypothetical protein